MTRINKPFCAVLLAAGLGSRLGNVPKSLLRLDGVTLLARHIAALNQAGAEKIVLVTGFFHNEIEAEAQQIIATIHASAAAQHIPQSLNLKQNISHIQIVRNLQPERGQQSSVRLGLQEIETSCLSALSHGAEKDHSPVMIALADQPLVNADDYSACVAAFDARPTDRSIVYPVVSNQRGNPVILSRDSIDQILKDNTSCRTYIDEHPEKVHHLVTTNDHYLFDIDQPRDLERFLERTGLTLQWPLDF